MIYTDKIYSKKEVLSSLIKPKFETYKIPGKNWKTYN